MSTTYPFPAPSNPDFSDMDNARISGHHGKIMFISGMGFFTDAYDVFIIGVVMTLLKPLWHVQSLEESLVESTALLASAVGALLFGRVADMLGRKNLWVRSPGPYPSEIFPVRVRTTGHGIAAALGKGAASSECSCSPT